MPDPVIYVPGLPASHLRSTNPDKRIFIRLSPGAFGNALLRGPNDLSVDDGVREDGPISSVKLGFIDIARQAKSLYKRLKKYKIVPVKFGWDWRRPVYDDTYDWSAHPRLARTIRDLRRDSGERVTIIVHSTGGLVLRKCLEQEPQLAASIRKVIAFGVPWAGTPQSMLYINAQSGFAGVVSAAKAQKVLVHAWAGFDLFPPNPAHLVDERGRALNLTFRQQGNGKRQVSALTDRDWLRSLPEALRAPALQRCIASNAHLGSRRPTIDLGGRRLEVVNVAGFGLTSPVAARLTGTGAHGKMRVEQNRGDDTLDGGDGTVPRVSASWLQGDANVDVSTYNIPVGIYPSSARRVHKSLWSNPGSINLLDHHLGGRDLKPFCYSAIDVDDWMPGAGHGPNVRIRCVALDAAGAKLQDARVATRNYSGGNVEEDFDADRDGRHLLTLNRQRIPRHDTVRRLMLEIRWTDNGRSRSQQRTIQLGA